MTIDEAVERIISTRPEISREDILKKLKHEEARSGGLIAKEILLKLVAASFGVDLNDRKSVAPTLSLKDLIPNLNDVTVVGRVIGVSEPRSFSGKTQGKVASVMIADNNASVRVVLWNDKTDLIATGRIELGIIVRLSRSYTKEDRKGIIELHVGDKAEIDIEPNDVNENEFPTVRDLSTKIKNMATRAKGKRVNVGGLVTKAFEPGLFERKGSKAGKVMRLVLRDETGEVPVVVWNEKVDEISNALEKDAGLQIVNAKVKKSLTEGVEIHVDSSSYLQILGDGVLIVDLNDLHEGMRGIGVQGDVVDKPIVRTVRTAKGETVQVANFELKDKTGQVRVSAWRELAEILASINPGEKVILRKVCVKRGLGDKIEVVAGKLSSITASSAENRA